ncbi:MAG: acyl-ACP--UDP-N-acetylglucosamine O-acyltransferase [Candidatus Brocadia sp. AMX2]|uniref:UDP-N-acetylglucosamine acetyltransferase n=1 Tax=Candidatus Brocadia sinica JPN1 TaxID=1197129 RepID=A0ABQ0JWV2_9BACT|nr:MULTISPECIES: acyl-ACP--UDP-N-acetylglucosamine O-acyltransferase [Brocadia]MBC6931846.1 acyl-ACP--UDP-N-acetylglucosamine O-acyltransferase [Candidatus Brocadia sp.]MBL1167299.1 acyl-ACP--UDP-N-acetylglucosamine O-acyltransferase [Candidatus Brocadia sp. AMX1]MCK6466829.1 acyl-ACP--UDP-N-acetylglucosamine O-acyltransferase [Candidatus Brocadia sinica]NOG41228.1 acyl-ACP--UDP-N-acetylglucosamine O-acyltransferase [Planctomycetota bacterium]KAA0245707.1 MAG: acyl-ACP--UDP-N-acetylglucosamine
MKIHKSAIVHPNAVLGKEVEVGPFSIIGADVTVGDGTVIKNHVTVVGNTILGRNNVIYPNAVLGAEPQDLKYHGERTLLVLGDHNVVREGVTINIGTAGGGEKTVIGDNNFFMACAHIAHDCIIEDNVLLANGVLLGGHVVIERGAKLMGLVGIQPFVTIGRHAYVGGHTRIVQDVPPYVIIEGHPAKIRQVNVIGLERDGFSKEQIGEIKEAFMTLFRSRELNKSKALEELESKKDISPEVKYLIAFLRNMDKGKFGRYRESFRYSMVATT